MSLRQILLLLITILYFGFCYWFVNYACDNCQTCQSRAAAAAAVVPPPIDAKPAQLATEPILFDWSQANAITSDSFPGFKKYILGQQSSDKVLEITGYYSDKEAAPKGYANMGLARADATKKLFLEGVPDAQIALRARKVDEPEKAREKAFKSVGFKWIDKAVAAPEEELNKVEEIGDRAIIYFPSNSSQKERNPSIDEYLTKLAKRVKDSKEKILLSGHTDSDGSSEGNLKLSRNRARQIRTILQKKGVSSSRIEITGKGEAEPEAPNDTAANKRLNRRVEVRLLK